jgi:alkylation response protein AidB-like acyl-CoA dehydrogenase
VNARRQRRAAIPGPTDHETTPMLLSEDHRAVQDAVRSFVRAEIAPHSAAWDKHHTFPKDALRGLAELGCFGVAVPAELGGAGLDYLALAVILEEVAAGDGATSTIVSVNNCPVCSILLAFGNADQQRRFLVPLARGEMLGAFCLTEPHVGSEAGGLRTTATRVTDGDGDAYVLDGVKQFITSGKHGDIAIVMAVTDKAAGKKGISAFVVPTATPGYIVERLEDKMGQHASDTAQIRFERCRVPAANRLGEEGQGLKIALSGLEGGRIGIASQAVGMARAAFDAALAYSKQRESFGQPIFNHQAVQFKLADMATQIECARQLIHHAAALKDAGRPCLKEAAMAKLFASEMAERVCSDAIQVHGGYGYVSDFPVERIYRDVRVCQIYEGTSEVQKILIGRALA